MGLLFSEDWLAISMAFERMFHGLGEVHIDEEILQYRSCPPSVPTGIAITKEGALVANMPLHAIQSRFTHVSFESDGSSLTLVGHESRYTYTVPDEIFALRSP
ncbi:MAG TPA: hypothetical protein D7H91_00435 [Candidatus Poseidoniales archaeon]|nr:MAG TPA: hypothetical protein D7H91_00435 [Candidatus Poseidoniales archaeon]HII77475.1 hypothetical protein [Poseidonia sp.]|tara:strand:+ start:1196 stop:1504 length:309 start_codon:yes stop_codon:yes gene_type:complete